MKTSIILMVAILCILGSACLAATGDFVKDFSYEKADLASTGSNPYFILEPGFQLTYKSDTGDLVITVLNETKTVDGVVTRIIEEREKDNGKLVEVSRNYFAISTEDNSVYYFGEAVDMYNKQGKITGHGGSWLAGVKGAKAGMAMPGDPKVGMKYYQEVAPGDAMDRAEILSITETMKVPAGTMKNVLKTVETSPIEPGTKEDKYYAKGIGQIKDEDLVLVKHGYIKK
jgi:hypothetical protein